MEQFESESVNTLKSEHLNEGVKPIIACVGTSKEYDLETVEFLDIKRYGFNVDFKADSRELRSRGLRNAGKETYVISTIDSRPKFTEGLFECTSLVAVGTDAEDARSNFSFLTHQVPGSFLILNKPDFISDLKDRLNELKGACAPGTVDIVIVGGQIYEMYEGSIKLLSSVVEDVFGFTPTVIVGPKGTGRDDVYFDNNDRRLYVIRPDAGRAFNDSFSAEETPDKIKEWRKK